MERVKSAASKAAAIAASSLKLTIESISLTLDPKAAEAFVRPLDTSLMSVDGELVQRLVDEVDGYPYFIQLWGSELFDAAVDRGQTELDVALLRELTPRLYARLDRDFYNGRVE